MGVVFSPVVLQKQLAKSLRLESGSDAPYLHGFATAFAHVLGSATIDGGGATYIAGSGLELSGATFSVDSSVVRTSSSYANPAWVSSLAASKLTGSVGAANGGLGLSTSAAATGSILYTSGTGTWAVLAPGTNGKVLKLDSGVPAWATETAGTTYSAGDGLSLATTTFSVDNTVVRTSGTYSDPAWITSLAATKIAAGTAGIDISGNAATVTSGVYVNAANTFTTGPQTVRRDVTGGPSYTPNEGYALENTDAVGASDGSDAPAVVWKSLASVDSASSPLEWAAYTRSQSGSGSGPYGEWNVTARHKVGAGAWVGWDRFISFFRSYSGTSNDNIAVWKDVVTYGSTDFAGGIWLRSSGNVKQQIIKRESGTDNVQIQATAAGGLIVTTDQSGVRTSVRARNTLVPAQVSGTSQTMAVGYGYSPQNASLTTFTLPTTIAVGDRIAVWGYGAGGWTIAQGAGQIIYSGASSSTSGTGGTVSSDARYSCITLECVVANLEFRAISTVGSMTFV